MNEPSNTPPADPWQSARRQLAQGRLSVIMPAYRLGTHIATNIYQVHDLFSKRIPVEIIPVDDGSDDNTRSEIDRAAAELPNVNPVHLDVNTGKGAALRRGFEASTGTYILLLDGDLELPPDQVAGFFEIMERDDADVVIGSKMHPGSKLHYPWYRRLLSVTYYGIVKLLVGLPIHDTQTGIKLFKRATLDYAISRMLVKRYAFDLEILAIIHEKGYKIAEAPVTLEFKAGLGCMRPRTIKQIMQDTLAIFYRIRVLHYYRSLLDLNIPEPPPLISILIPYAKPTAYLGECLTGIQTQHYRRFEVILLPDQPSDRNWSDNIKEVATGAAADVDKFNKGMLHARGEIVAFLDASSRPVDDWLQRAIGYFSHPDIAAVGGPQSATGQDHFMAKLGARVLTNTLVSAKIRYRYHPDRVRIIDDHPLGNLLVRIDDLRSVGGLHSDVPDGEDIRLGVDLRTDLNRRLVYDPWAQVYRHWEPLFFPHLKRMARQGMRRGCFVRSCPSAGLRLANALPVLFTISLAVGAFLAVLSPQFRPVYLAASTVYAAAVLLSSIHWTSLLLHLQPKPIATILTAIGVFATHLVYGTALVFGLLSSRSRITRNE